MQFLPRKPQIKLQKNFTASRKPSPRPMNEELLASWETNFTNLQNHWRSTFLNARMGKGKMDLNSARTAFFKAEFEFRKHLRQHSTLPHEVILAFEKKLQSLTDELKGMQ